VSKKSELVAEGKRKRKGRGKRETGGMTEGPKRGRTGQKCKSITIEEVTEVQKKKKRGYCDGKKGKSW